MAVSSAKAARRRASVFMIFAFSIVVSVSRSDATCCAVPLRTDPTKVKSRCSITLQSVHPASAQHGGGEHASNDHLGCWLAELPAGRLAITRAPPTEALERRTGSRVCIIAPRPRPRDARASERTGNPRKWRVWTCRSPPGGSLPARKTSRPPSARRCRRVRP